MYTPDMNNGTNIFVFGSNEAGRHGRGAALEARKHWGAETGVGIGRTGQAYAIPTKDRNLRVLPLETIAGFVDYFLHYAGEHPELTFLLTKIGCGLAGYTESEIGPMFSEAPPNVVQPVWCEPNPRFKNLTHFKVPFLTPYAVNPTGLPVIFKPAWEVYSEGRGGNDWPAETVERFMATCMAFLDRVNYRPPGIPGDDEK